MTKPEKNNNNDGKATTAQPDNHIQELQGKINGLETEITNILTVAKAKVDQLKQEIQTLKNEKQLLEQDKQNQSDQSVANQKVIEETNQSLDNIQAVMVQVKDLFK